MDVTDEKLLRQQLRDLQRELERAQEINANFIRAVSMLCEAEFEGGVRIQQMMSAKHDADVIRYELRAALDSAGVSIDKPDSWEYPPRRAFERMHERSESNVPKVDH
jgi:hypothetical protein